MKSALSVVLVSAIARLSMDIIPYYVFENLVVTKAKGYEKSCIQIQVGYILLKLKRLKGGS